MKHRELLETLFRAAVDAADPLVGIRAHLPKQPAGGRTVVVGAGKGAAQMAAALETVWQGPLEGLVVTRYGFACQTRSIEVVEASHPVPDAAGLAASRRLLELVSVLSPDDLVIALISGGGSALLPAPPAGFALDDEIALNQILLASGAPISAMNVLRKHFSTIKGGRLALATRARVASLIVSDIPGDNPAFVASGPTVPDPTTRYDALAIVENYRLPLTPKMLAHLASPAADAPVPEDPAFARNTHRVIASASVSLEAAARVARDHGFETHILSDSVEGESRDVGFVHAAIAREIVSRGRPFQTPAVLLSGGETTVTLRGKGGRGGRNSEFALAFATASAGLPVTALAADTDGIDGVGDHAGAFVDGETIRRLTARGFDGRRLLMENDSYSGFEAIGDLFITGPTGTNVNDFRAIVIE